MLQSVINKKLTFASQPQQKYRSCEEITISLPTQTSRINSSKHELKRYTLFKTSRGHFCTKIRNCHNGCFVSRIVHLSPAAYTTDAPLHAEPLWDNR